MTLREENKEIANKYQTLKSYVKKVLDMQKCDTLEKLVQKILKYKKKIKDDSLFQDAIVQEVLCFNQLLIEK